MTKVHEEREKERQKMERAKLLQKKRQQAVEKKRAVEAEQAEPQSFELRGKALPWRTKTHSPERLNQTKRLYSKNLLLLSPFKRV